MNILMPLADGERINTRTLTSICMQQPECYLVPITRPRNAQSRRISEAECRNEFKHYTSKPYSMMLDSDAYYTSSHDVSDCAAFLDEHTEWDAVALDTKMLGSIEKTEKRGHVVIAAVCIRYEALQRVTFRPTYEAGGRERCLCVAVNQDLRIRYLDNRQLGEIKR